MDKVQLYAVADPSLCLNRDLIEVVAQAIEGGAQMVQLRDKKSGDGEFLELTKKIHKITRKKRIPLIINDRVDVARLVDAEGVHLGEEDLPVKEARKILGSKKIIGASASDIKTAKIKEKEGADYIGLGPVFETGSKEIEKPLGVEIIKEAKRSLKIPVFPIGGINLSNLDQIISTGTKRIAVISAIFMAEDVRRATRELLRRLK
ncbi:MAG: thiamine-phosphate diphosphorylase [candidate division Zixibacteria bacterium RBG_16_43_9]|nr:MAG: thiamine-phosphate diphosphorylase [candidate division Zixibacteria bacterium RBG_16_43_9]